MGPVLLCRSHALAPQVSKAGWTMQAARVNSARQLTHYAYPVIKESIAIMTGLSESPRHQCRGPIALHHVHTVACVDR